LIVPRAPNGKAKGVRVPIYREVVRLRGGYEDTVFDFRVGF